MKLHALLTFSLAATYVQASAVAHAEEHRETRHEEHQGGHDGHPAPRPRPAPPRFEPHPRGIHPRGATVHPHAVRIMRPHIAKFGVHPWHHWAHPEFVRPIYYWDWAKVRQVTCVAEDSYGDQYPITEETVSGFGLIHMSTVEDDALDRCYAESGNDQSCFLATCSHF